MRANGHHDRTRPDGSSDRVRGSWLAGLALPLTLGFALAASAQTIHFDDLPGGQPVTSVSGIAFSHSDPQVDLVVASGEPSTSSPHFLGARQAAGASPHGQDLFLPGDVLILAFDPPTLMISLEVVATPATPTAAFELRTATGSVVSGAPTGSAGNDEVYSLTLSDSTLITWAEIRSTTGLFAYHIDDLQRTPAPEPASGACLIVGATALAWAERRRMSPRKDDSR